MEKSTQDRFASGFRGKGKTEDKKPEADVASVIEPAGDTGAAATDGAADTPNSGGPGTGSEAGAAAHGETDMPEMTQSEKSWQGRLKKREDELKAREAALSGANPTGDGAAAATGAPKGAEPEPKPTAPAMDPNEAGESAIEEARETPAEESAEVAAGEELPGSTSDIMANAPDDIKAIAKKFNTEFGEEFIDEFAKLFGYIAEARAGTVASEAIGPLKKQADDVQGMLNSVIEGFQGMHQGDIEDGEPEFEQVVNSPEFEQWVTSQPEADQGRVVKTLQGGSASRILRVLKQFKDSLGKDSAPEGKEPEATPGMVDTSALDAAAGVRSTGAIVPSITNASGGGSAEDDFARGFARARKPA